MGRSRGRNEGEGELGDNRRGRKEEGGGGSWAAVRGFSAVLPKGSMPCIDVMKHLATPSPRGRGAPRRSSSPAECDAGHEAGPRGLPGGPWH